MTPATWPRDENPTPPNPVAPEPAAFVTADLPVRPTRRDGGCENRSSLLAEPIRGKSRRVRKRRYATSLRHKTHISEGAGRRRRSCCSYVKRLILSVLLLCRWGLVGGGARCGGRGGV